MLKRIDSFKNWIGRRKATRKDYLTRLFRFKYSAFRMLLESNTQFLQIIADIDEKLHGDEVFGIAYVRNQANRARFHALRMVKNLDDLSDHHYPGLFESLGRIERNIQQELDQRKEPPSSELVLTYDRINKEMVDSVGGKNANLGEMCSRLQLPVPEGFAITAGGFTSFLSHNDLFERISAIKMEIDPRSPESIAGSSAEIQRLITSAEVPAELESAIRSAYEGVCQRASRSQHDPFFLNMSLRSSAVGEDSDLSFAGQYLSVLNVPGQQVIAAYKQVIASLYTPPAITYRLNKGIRDEDIAMGVACLQMVDAVASGVMYTRHPFNYFEDNIMITAFWGLGPSTVDGRVTPDSYTVDKKDTSHVLSRVVAHKTVHLVNLPGGGIQELSVAEEDRDRPCLTSQQINILAQYALTLEMHYKNPQDIEWALDPEGKLLLLQSRPLRVESLESDLNSLPVVSDCALLIKEGTVAYPGVGFGPAFQVKTDEDLLNFPEGAILVAKHSSPKFVLAMKRARAIITDIGSVAGHMASLAREFAIPTILDTKIATATIPTGMQVTVDAFSGKVYQGTAAELQVLQKKIESPMKHTPVYQALRKLADYIVPLSLTDPKAANFAPEHCSTLHDISRFVHEKSYAEMFEIGDFVSGKQGVAVKLEAKIPVDLYVIDVGGGIAAGKEEFKRIKISDVESVPFKALLHGMTHDAFQQAGPRPVSLSGFVSVVMEQATAPPPTTDRFGEASFAIISNYYLNFSSRVGYHYSALDSHCGPSVDANYISFSFKGGAADYVRRNRRVRAIALILKKLDFTVNVHEDLVDARLQKYPCDLITERLDLIGRLLLFTRQMDMLMKDEESVPAFAQNFLAGDYSLGSGP